MKMIESHGINKAVVLEKLLIDNRLVVVDNETTIRFFDKNELTLQNGFKAKQIHKYYASNTIAFSDNGKYFASITSDYKESLLFSVKTKKVFGRVNRHQGEVSCVGIDPLSRYMFSGGEDGKTFAIDMKSGKLFFTLPAHADTINDIAFSSNGNWVATASYDRKIKVFSLVSMSPKVILKGHSKPVMKMRFLSDNRIVTTDKGSSTIIWDYTTGKIIARLEGVHDTVTQIISSKDDEFLFLGTKLGYIMLYCLKTYELLSGKYIKIAAAITALEFDKEKHILIVGTDDGFVFYYDIYENEELINDLFKERKFDAIQKEASLNPVLKSTQIYNLISNFWDNVLAKAKVALQSGDTKKALLLFSSFKDIPAKKTIIKKTIANYADFPKFKKLAKEGKLALAYGLANQFPDYKDSSMYKALEKQWKEKFVTAQKYSLEPQGQDKAKEILKPYRGIPEKTKLIQELLMQGEVYKRFRVVFAQKDFRVCQDLAKQHLYLKEFPEYETMMNYADRIYMKIHESLSSNNTQSAMKMLRTLSIFDMYKEEVATLMSQLEANEKFFIAVESEDYVKAYNMMDRNEILANTKEGNVLQARWNSDQEIANSYAVVGDAEGVKKSFTSYMKISSKLTAIATTFAWCYMVQLEDKARDNASQVEIEKGIKNYMLNFGLQEQIEIFYTLFKEKYPSSKLTLEHLTQGSMSMWRPSMIVTSILN